MAAMHAAKGRVRGWEREDLEQELLAEIVARQHQYSALHGVWRAWCNRVARNRLLDLIRATRTQKRSGVECPYDEERQGLEASCETTYTRRAAYQRWREGLETGEALEGLAERAGLTRRELDEAITTLDERYREG